MTPNLATLAHHADLMSRMAETVEADLSGALLRGQIDAAGLRVAVLRCTSCAAANTCETWLADQHGHAAGAVRPVIPAFCVNADLMDRLQP